MFNNYLINPPFSLLIAIGVSVIAFGITYLVTDANTKEGEWKNITVKEHSMSNAIMVAIIFLFLGFIAIAAMPPTENTDKLSEAVEVDNDQFIKKVTEVTDLDNVQYIRGDYRKVSPTVDEFEKGEFFEMTGLKDGQKKQIIVFFKEDEMKITVSSPKTDAQNVEEFSYQP